MAIIVEYIRLEELELKVRPEYSGNLQFNLSFNCRSEFPEPHRLIQITDWNLAHGMENAPFVFRFKYVSEFRHDGEGTPTIEEFAESNAPAYVVPYARELIANITARLGVVPPLVLPPINVFKLVQTAKSQSDQGNSRSSTE